MARKTRAAVAGALLFWIAVGLIQKLNWGFGAAKALVLLALFVALPVVAAAAERRGGDRGAAPRSLVLASLTLLALQVAYALWQLRHPGLTDIATTTLAAGDKLRAGGNPYAASFDASAGAGAARFGGYKYLPVMIAAYLPLGAPLAERGVVLTNLLLGLATTALVFGLAARLAGSRAAWLATLLYLSLPLVPFQLFAKGVTDLAAVAPLLLALLVLERSPISAGLCVGLSIAAKLLPGALLLPCCLPATNRARLHFGGGVALGLLPALPFLLWSPGAFIDNIVLFNLERPADSTSWLFAMPPFAATLAHLVAIAAYGTVAAYVWRRPPSLLQRTALATMLMLLALLTGPTAHHNYQLWWLPFFAALLGVALERGRDAGDAKTVRQ
ncbi:MAG TPA: glycosyltransferase 87 family protein [Stellaceae bacterium]|nr:glycosyltransferase 87 family protein [Stellaceae bacterium]